MSNITCTFFPNKTITLPTNCPPIEAEDQSIEVYRVVLNNPPIPEDFYPQILLKPHIRYSNECDFSGISVFLKKEDAQYMAPKIQQVIKNHGIFYIAKGTITIGSGKILEDCKNPKNNNKPTRSHANWWVIDTEGLHENFEVLGG